MLLLASWFGLEAKSALVGSRPLQPYTLKPVVILQVGIVKPKQNSSSEEVGSSPFFSKSEAARIRGSARLAGSHANMHFGHPAESIQGEESEAGASEGTYREAAKRGMTRRTEHRGRQLLYQSPQATPPAYAELQTIE